MADLERNRIKERCDAGRGAARASLSSTGRTHRGKTGLSRPFAADAGEVRMPMSVSEVREQGYTASC